MSKKRLLLIIPLIPIVLIFFVVQQTLKINNEFVDNGFEPHVYKSTKLISSYTKEDTIGDYTFNYVVNKSSLISPYNYIASVWVKSDDDNYNIFIKYRNKKSYPTAFSYQLGTAESSSDCPIDSSLGIEDVPYISSDCDSEENKQLAIEKHDVLVEYDETIRAALSFLE